MPFYEVFSPSRRGVAHHPAYAYDVFFISICIHGISTAIFNASRITSGSPLLFDWRIARGPLRPSSCDEAREIVISSLLVMRCAPHAGRCTMITAGAISCRSRAKRCRIRCSSITQHFDSSSPPFASQLKPPCPMVVAANRTSAT